MPHPTTIARQKEKEETQTNMQLGYRSQKNTVKRDEMTSRKKRSRTDFSCRARRSGSQKTSQKVKKKYGKMD